MSSEDFAINAVKYFFRSLINLCSSGGQHFLKRGAQSPTAAVSGVPLQLTPLPIREALSAQDASSGQGNGANTTSCAQLSKQPVPAPSRDLSNWSSTSQPGTAEPRASLDRAGSPGTSQQREKLTHERQQNSTDSSGITQGMVLSCLYLHL